MSLYIDAGMLHGVTNTGKVKLLIAFFVAPGKDKTVVPSDLGTSTAMEFIRSFSL